MQKENSASVKQKRCVDGVFLKTDRDEKYYYELNEEKL